MIVTAYRRAAIPGPLIALALVPAAALVGMELAAGRLVTALEALRRVGLDMLLVVVLGGGVLFIKQRVIHHNRHPMI